MTNEEAMRLMTEVGLHEGGMDNWVMDNAYVDFIEHVQTDFKNRLAQAIEQMPFGDTAASFAAFVRNFK